MKKLLVVIGSIRKVRVADSIHTYLNEALEPRNDFEVTTVDLKDANLPFFNNERSPSSPEFHEDNEAVTTWTRQVAEADAVLFITPEYNHTLSPVQINAIDWIFKEWKDKPVSALAYGYYGGIHSLNALHELAPVVFMDFKANPAQFVIGKDIDASGAVLEGVNVHDRITTTLNELA